MSKWLKYVKITRTGEFNTIPPQEKNPNQMMVNTLYSDRWLFRDELNAIDQS